MAVSVSSAFCTTDTVFLDPEGGDASHDSSLGILTFKTRISSAPDGVEASALLFGATCLDALAGQTA